VKHENRDLWEIGEAFRGTRPLSNVLNFLWGYKAGAKENIKLEGRGAGKSLPTAVVCEELSKNKNLKEG